jgi:hypothetical protein
LLIRTVLNLFAYFEIIKRIKPHMERLLFVIYVFERAKFSRDKIYKKEISNENFF